MGELDTRQAVPRPMQAELRALKAQTSLEGVWDLLMPTQREAVFQTVVQVCRQLVYAHRGDDKEGRNE
jgi:hypothetical protein